MKIFTRYKKFFQQDGQTAVFFALLLPVLILFLFVVFDLGWLYLNKSRLQNAAEAAAIAGANQFCAESTEGYNSVMLVYDYDRELNKTIINSTAGVEQATSDSWKSNLVGNTTSDEDSWTKATVTMPVSKFLGESADAETIYYEVKLTENVGHIFKVLDILPFTNVPAVAVAEITKVDDTPLAELALLPQMQALNETQTMGNWEEQNVAYGKSKNATAEELEKGIYFNSKAEDRERLYYDGKWNHFQDAGDSTKSQSHPTTDAKYNRAQIHYTTGERYKYENIEVGGANSTVTVTKANGSYDTKENGYGSGIIYSDDIVDSLNIDFRQDVTLTFDGTDDWDIGFDLTGTKITEVKPISSEYIDNWGTPQMNLRIHVTVNFNHPYETRELSEEDKAKVDARYKISGVADSADADPLYVRIESEPMVSKLYGTSTKTLNSVRQIILNINETNIDDDDNEKTHEYKYRPLVIFYNGPEKNNSESGRESQPVIVNLKADFRGILFMPNSPVVLNGNGHKFQGFVIAKEFRKLKTENDYADYAKFTLEAGNKEVYIEKVTTYTEPDSDDEVMVKKTGTDYWFKVKKSALYYTDEYKRFIVTDDSVGKSIHYLVERTTTVDIDTTNKLENYDTTTYYRQKDSESRTPAYIRTNLRHNTDYSYSDNIDIFKGKKDQWYEVKDNQNNETYSIRNANSNFLFYKDGWRIITDEDNNQYITKITKDNINDFIEINNYVEVTDANGKTAYVSDFDYFSKKSDAEPLILDSHGNVQYTDKLPADYSLGNRWKLDAKGKTPCFYPSTFGLMAIATDKSDTHYSRCGVVPTRRRYKVLDAFESGGNYCQDMFFTTTRSKQVL